MRPSLTTCKTYPQEDRLDRLEQVSAAASDHSMRLRMLEQRLQATDVHGNEVMSDAASRAQAMEARLESRIAAMATNLGRYESANADLRRRLDVRGVPGAQRTVLLRIASPACSSQRRM